MLNKIKILYEDIAILVVDKPSGLVVNRADTVKEKVTLMDWLEERLKITDFSTEFGMRRGLVHRLDKETSGVMVMAKTKEAFENLQGQFKERTVQKEYIALAHDGLGAKIQGPKRDNPEIPRDCPELHSDFSVDAPIGRNPKNRFKWAIVEGGREARTEFMVERKFERDPVILGRLLPTPESEVKRDTGIDSGRALKGLARMTENFLLLRCFPKTGRTHQIRVHLTALNCPVVSDSLYLNKRSYNEDIKWCPRMFLHAHKLGFFHPTEGKWVEFSAELPKELCSILPLSFA